MFPYLCKRFLFALPTLVGILTINFFVVQLAPGGPVESMVAQLQGEGNGYMDRVIGGSDDNLAHAESNTESSLFKGNDSLDPTLVEEIKAYYGFDKPLGHRYLALLKNYLKFDLGESFFRDYSVVELIKEKMPVSISLGLWTTLLTYFISIPLGIAKAVRRGSPFDGWTSFSVVVASAIPVFLFAILLVMLFASGSGVKWFPLRGLVSPGFDQMRLGAQILDYFWHMCLPVTAMTIGGFAGLTMLTRNCFLDELGKLYVVAARAKGLTENRILYTHIFRNAMLIVISGFPGVFIGIFFTGAMMIEIIFSLDGLGLMGFEATMQRDYPVMFGTLYISTLLGLVLKIVSDISYALVDPRINFDARRQ